MKTKFILLASFALGTAAIAQDAAPMQSAPPAASDVSPAPAPSATPDAATQATPPAPTDSNASAPVSDAATPSAGAATADASTYPACSRGVADKCVQSHARHSRTRPR